MSLLAGKIAVVTGGARGIGRAIVERFAAEGATGAILDLTGAHASEFPRWRIFHADVRDDDSVRDAFSEVGPVDIVVAAAGVVPAWSELVAIDPVEWDEVFRVNVRGVMSTIRHSLPQLREGGSIVVVGSLNSWRGDPNIASYVASKHAVLGLVRSAALALGRRGVRVNALAPGPIATEALLARMAKREEELGIPVERALADAAEQTALGRLATVHEVANAALFLASDLSSGVTGQLMRVDAGVP